MCKLPIFDSLKQAPRLLLEAELAPLQGNRFQPTGFPHLGAGRYQLHNGVEMLLVESVQSMANRLEAVCWDAANEDLVEILKGLPYVRIDLGTYGKTNTVLEFHRLNSPYIWGGQEDFSGTSEKNKKTRDTVGAPASKEFRTSFREALGLVTKHQKKKEATAPKDDPDEAETYVPGVLDLKKLAQAVFKYDPNCVLHGVFLEKLDGRLRLTRALSGVIEARNVTAVESGGAKFDRVFPAKQEDMGITSADGYTNVPFHRTEFTAESIVAYFDLDLALLRSYGLGDAGFELLVGLALFKIRRLLSEGLRLRSACSLQLRGDLLVKAPKDTQIPKLEDLESCLKNSLIGACKGSFANPPITDITWTAKPPSKRKGGKDSDSLPAAGNAEGAEQQDSGDNDGGR